MRFYKIIDNGYILRIGTGLDGTEITETEYNEIMSAIQNRPQATETTDYRLKTDLTWESYEREPDPEPEPEDSDKAEAYDILMGVIE